MTIQEAPCPYCGGDHDFITLQDCPATFSPRVETEAAAARLQERMPEWRKRLTAKDLTEYSR